MPIPATLPPHGWLEVRLPVQTVLIHDDLCLSLFCLLFLLCSGKIRCPVRQLPCWSEHPQFVTRKDRCHAIFVHDQVAFLAQCVQVCNPIHTPVLGMAINTHT